MNFLNKILSLTKEDAYRIIVRYPKWDEEEERDDSEIVKDFFVNGHLSMHNERMWNPAGEIYEYQSVQFITNNSIDNLLDERDNEKKADWWLIDSLGRELKLVKQNDYRAKNGVLSPFQNVVYKGRVEYE